MSFDPLKWTPGYVDRTDALAVAKWRIRSGQEAEYRRRRAKAEGWHGYQPEELAVRTRTKGLLSIEPPTENTTKEQEQST